MSLEDIESREERAAHAAEESLARASDATEIAARLAPDVDAPILAAAERFLARSRDLFREAIAWERKRCPGVEPQGRLAAHDLARIARGPLHDGRLPTEHAVKVALATIAAMRLDPPALPPSERRGLGAWRDALRLGGTSVAPRLGPVLERVLTEPLWLARSAEIGQPEIEATRRTAATAMLFDARRTAALLSWAAALANGIVEPSRAFTERMTEAMDAQWPEGGWAAEVEADGGARFRRELEEPALWESLRERLDEDWFRNPRAGAFLRGAVRDDAAPDADLLARRFEGLLG